MKEHSSTEKFLLTSANTKIIGWLEMTGLVRPFSVI